MVGCFGRCKELSFGFHKMRGISRLVEKLSALEEGRCSTDLVMYLVIYKALWQHIEEGRDFDLHTLYFALRYHTHFNVHVTVHL